MKTYTHEDALRYRKRLHEKAGEAERLRHELEFERWRAQTAYNSGKQAISGGGATMFSWTDAHTAGCCVAYLAATEARIAAERRGYRSSRVDHWLAKRKLWAWRGRARLLVTFPVFCFGLARALAWPHKSTATAAGWRAWLRRRTAADKRKSDRKV